MVPGNLWISCSKAFALVYRILGTATYDQLHGLALPFSYISPIRNADSLAVTLLAPRLVQTTQDFELPSSMPQFNAHSLQQSAHVQLYTARILEIGMQSVNMGCMNIKYSLLTHIYMPQMWQTQKRLHSDHPFSIAPPSEKRDLGNFPIFWLIENKRNTCQKIWLDERMHLARFFGL